MTETAFIGLEDVRKSELMLPAIPEVTISPFSTTTLGLKSQPLPSPEAAESVLNPSILSDFMAGVRLEFVVSRCSWMLIKGFSLWSRPARDKGRDLIR